MTLHVRHTTYKILVDFLSVLCKTTTRNDQILRILRITFILWGTARTSNLASTCDSVCKGLTLYLIFVSYLRLETKHLKAYRSLFENIMPYCCLVTSFTTLFSDTWVHQHLFVSNRAKYTFLLWRGLVWWWRRVGSSLLSLFINLYFRFVMQEL